MYYAVERDLTELMNYFPEIDGFGICGSMATDTYLFVHPEKGISDVDVILIITANINPKRIINRYKQIANTNSNPFFKLDIVDTKSLDLRAKLEETDTDIITYYRYINSDPIQFLIKPDKWYDYGL